MRKASSIAFVALLAGVGIYPDWGTTAMIRAQPAAVDSGAETIVLGTVAHQESAWNATHTAIYTDVILASRGDDEGCGGV